jgi:ribose 5-phosphate isomerase B
MTISFGNDHAGFPMRKTVLAKLRDLGVTVLDHGSPDESPVDFPDIAGRVAADVAAGRAERGLLLCGTGVGASIAANKVSGIRAAVIHDTHCAHQGVEHDDMNVLCLGAQIVGPWLAADIIEVYVKARFDGAPDHVRRLEKLAEMERKSARELSHPQPPSTKDLP